MVRARGWGGGGGCGGGGPTVVLEGRKEVGQASSADSLFSPFPGAQCCGQGSRYPDPQAVKCC